MKKELNFDVLWAEWLPIALFVFIFLMFVTVPGIMSFFYPEPPAATWEAARQFNEPVHPKRDEVLAEKFSSRFLPTPAPAQAFEARGKPLPKRVNSFALPVLMYHRISDNPDKYNLAVPVNNFREQMDYLRLRGFHTVKLAQLGDYLLENKPLPPKSVLITFDDGNQDNLTTALPILAEHGFTAAVFVIGGFVGQSGSVSLDDIKTLAAAGWDIGNHTFSHPDLAALAQEQQTLELKQCNAVLEQALPGKSLIYFAYPCGRYNDNAIRALKSNGFVLAFSTNPGWVRPDNNPYAIPRIFIGPKTTLRQFAAKVTRPFYTH